LPLPCKHDKSITEQVQPTIHLLRNMDTLHPNILQQHNIHPEDYNGNLVFRSAVESIRGTYISSSTSSRHGLIQRVLARMRMDGLIADFLETSKGSRSDFQVTVAQNPDYFASIEVKGGEGNSINISNRPIWAKEFAVWCHLDGAIVNQPAHGTAAILNRLMRELVIEAKQVDALFIRDVICGTELRPCPKYPGRECTIGDGTAPDIFLLPQRRPTPDDPEPPAHTLDTLRLPRLILQQFGIMDGEIPRHVWQVSVKVEEVGPGTFRRAMTVRYMDQVILQRTSRSWRY
jgi:hypothetical protein